MNTINDFITYAVENNASDLHITTGRPPIVRKNGALQEIDGIEIMKPDTIAQLIEPIIPKNKAHILEEKGDIDFAYATANCRLRVNIFKQRGSYAVALRLLARDIPTLDGLGHPPIIKNLAMLPRGLVLVTGTTGSGKSTTLAALIDYINDNKQDHIITIEDPIEYLHRHKKSVINQREVNEDTTSFSDALRAALREDPDIILVGEMRDLDTIRAAITAAETGHLVFSTLHTMGAANTIDRIVDVFPHEQQQQVRIQLADALQGVISQQLLPLSTGKDRVAALEIMVRTDAIGNLIREGKSHQIDSFIQTGKELGMQSMDSDLARLVKTNKVNIDIAQRRAIDLKDFKRYLN
ncbi:MAG: type IV pilus twitching motility protein PilT [Eubacteriaceae bacterium]